MEINQNGRGFDFSSFTDRYGAKCSLQISSLATEDAIWLGVDNADPQIMCSDARKLGLEIQTGEDGDHNGFCKFEIPKEVSLTTRMHLTREMVADLLPHLQKFVETGDI